MLLLFLYSALEWCGWRLDCDYDRLEHVAEYDRLVRAIMGVADFGGQEHFHHKTISDNVCHVDAELLEKINEIVVRDGRQALKKTAPKSLKSRLTAMCWKATFTIPPIVICCWTRGASAWSCSTTCMRA